MRTVHYFLFWCKIDYRKKVLTQVEKVSSQKQQEVADQLLDYCMNYNLCSKDWIVFIFACILTVNGVIIGLSALC